MTAKKGFTLVELLVVVAIIAILVATLTPTFMGYADRARDARAMSDISSMKTVIEVYTADEGNGVYPTALNTDVTGTIKKVLSEHGIKWTGYNDGVKDPWGNAYEYQAKQDNTGYTIMSPGKDGTVNTADDITATESSSPSKIASGNMTILGTPDIPPVLSYTNAAPPSTP